MIEAKIKQKHKKPNSKNEFETLNQHLKKLGLRRQKEIEKSKNSKSFSANDLNKAKIPAHILSRKKIKLKVLDSWGFDDTRKKKMEKVLKHRKVF